MLFGREREQSLIDGMLEAARLGGGRTLVLVGEAGIGKSSLLAYAASRAEGMNLLRARGVQPEAQVPFAGLFELLRPAMGVLEQIPGPQATALEVAMALRPPGGGERFAIGAATLSVLAAYAELAPLLVLVDDAHWLDGSSADALAFAARRLSEDPVALLIAVREKEPSLLDGTDLPQLRLAGLDLAASSSLLRRHHGSTLRLTRGDLESLHRETAGNPLALLELSTYGERHGFISSDQPVPVVTSVAEVYASRFDRLSTATQQILVLAAASDTGNLAGLTRAAAAHGAVIEDLGAAESAGLVEVREGVLEWRHPLVRSAVYARATPSERRRAHRSLAASLPDADSDRRAWHLALSTLGPDGAASSALQQAAERARARNAYDVASRAFERAAQLSPDTGRRGDLLFAAADTAWLAGLAERALQLLESAGRHALGPPLTFRVQHLYGHIAARCGYVAEGQRLLVEAARAASDTEPSSAIVMLAEAVNASFHAGNTAAMNGIAAQLRPLARRCPDVRSQFFAKMSEGMALVFSGQGGTRGPLLIRRAVELLEASDELRENPRLLAWAAMGPLFLREGSRGHALIERAVAAVREGALVGMVPLLLDQVGFDLAGTDRWSEAEAAFHEAIGAARESGQRADLAIGLSRLALLEARCGREASSRAHAFESLELSARLGIALSEVWSLLALAELEAGLGRAEKSCARYEEALGVLRERGITDVDLFPGAELVEMYLRTGRREPALRTAEEFARAADAKGLPWAKARARRAEGLVASEDDFTELFLRSIAYHEETLDVFETARTRLAFGSRLRRTRRRVRAREELRAAMDCFDRLGAEPWGEVARAELAATGETARRRGEPAAAHLTPQELQIALLLAEGHTTKEAAAALFISPKTVEYHLRSVYRKLDVRTRDDLATAMRSQ